MTVSERIEKLRAVMKEKNVDAYLVPTDDYHCSEYVESFLSAGNISPVLLGLQEPQ